MLVKNEILVKNGNFDKSFFCKKSKFSQISNFWWKNKNCGETKQFWKLLKILWRRKFQKTVWRKFQKQVLAEISITRFGGNFNNKVWRKLKKQFWRKCQKQVLAKISEQNFGENFRTKFWRKFQNKILAKISEHNFGENFRTKFWLQLKNIYIKSVLVVVDPCLGGFRCSTISYIIRSFIFWILLSVLKIESS